jgi:hypothetical protein
MMMQEESRPRVPLGWRLELGLMFCLSIESTGTDGKDVLESNIPPSLFPSSSAVSRQIRGREGGLYQSKHSSLLLNKKPRIRGSQKHTSRFIGLFLFFVFFWGGGEGRKPTSQTSQSQHQFFIMWNAEDRTPPRGRVSQVLQGLVGWPWEEHCTHT